MQEPAWTFKKGVLRLDARLVAPFVGDAWVPFGPVVLIERLKFETLESGVVRKEIACAWTEGTLLSFNKSSFRIELSSKPRTTSVAVQALRRGLPQHYWILNRRFFEEKQRTFRWLPCSLWTATLDQEKKVKWNIEAGAAKSVSIRRVSGFHIEKGAEFLKIERELTTASWRLRGLVPGISSGTLILEPGGLSFSFEVIIAARHRSITNRKSSRSEKTPRLPSPLHFSGWEDSIPSAHEFVLP